MYQVLLLLTVFLVGVVHPIHLSRCEIEYNLETQSIQIAAHMFLDDLEASMLADGGPDSLFLCTKKEREDADLYLAEYLAKNLRFEVDGKPVYFEYLGKEISEDLLAVWSYMEVYGVEQMSELKITNTFILNLYDDQKNIVALKLPSERKANYLMFTKNVTWEKIPVE